MMEVYVIIPIATMAIMAMAEGIIAIRELGRLLFEHINNK